MSQRTRTARELRGIGDPARRFREASETFCGYLHAQGIKTLPYASPELKLFMALSPERQQAALEQLDLALEIFEELQRENIPLRDSPALMWRTLRKLGLTPQSDIFDKMGAEDVVEIYSVAQEQIFRNLMFFEVSSYTLEQILGIEWYKVTQRAPELAQRLWQLGQSIAQGRISGTIDPEMEDHPVEEVDSPGGHRFMMKIKYLSTLQKDGELAGTLVIHHTRVVGQKSE